MPLLAPVINATLSFNLIVTPLSQNISTSSRLLRNAFSAGDDGMGFKCLPFAKEMSETRHLVSYDFKDYSLPDWPVPQCMLAPQKLWAAKRHECRAPVASIYAPAQLCHCQYGLPAIKITSMTNSHFDLKARAHQAMIDAGFKPDFTPEVRAEVQALPKDPVQDPAGGVCDLRSLLWSSIDNDSSRDLDQVEYVDKLPVGGVRLLVGIADVDASVPKDSAIDLQAAVEGTSVYTGVTTFPMLPHSTVHRLNVAAGWNKTGPQPSSNCNILDTGEVTCHDVYQAVLRNQAKLAYSSVGAWLEGRGPIPPAVAKVSGMEAQLRLQQQLAEKLRGLRKQQGTLSFASVEASPIVENGEVKDLVVEQHNIAEDIIESFMVAANVAMAQYLKEEGALSIRRVVRTPKRWDRIQCVASQFGVKLPDVPDSRALADFLDQRKIADPVHFPDLSLSVVKMLGAGEYIVEHPGEEHEGHFGLAVQDYTHSTAPNRRYADLVTQRLLKAAAGGRPAPWSEAELGQIAAHCTDRSQAARSVERLMRKVVAAILLSKRIGDTFDGIITGATPKGTAIRN